MQAFVPKSRRLKFELTLKIIDLNNVPLTSGSSVCKWHLPHSAAAEHRGRTSKCAIRDHKVAYDYEKTVPVRMSVDKSNMLQDLAIDFEVQQEYAAVGKNERIMLGYVKLNLAEYVEASELEPDVGVCRRYLMQDSKINGTLKIGINMRLVEGDGNFIAPPLKTAPVFGGIAGIMAGEQGEADEPGHMPSLSSKSRETGEAQDMYRRNLAAYWSAQPGEMRADDCIEDIFAGGDGWSQNSQNARPSTPRTTPPPEERYGGHQTRHGHKHRGSRDSLLSVDNSPKAQDHRHHDHHRSRQDDEPNLPSGVSGRASLEHHANSMKNEATNRSRPNYEVSEFQLRDDLRSWQVSNV